MKKLLYGTTALATAGLVAGIAGDAAAAERIQLQISGYMQQWLVGVDQDFDDSEDRNRIPDDGVDNRTNQNHKTINVDQKTNAEVCFVGQTTLDNGITVGVNVQLEAFAAGNHIDETFLFVQSDRFGQLKIGSEDGAASLLTVNAPDGGISVDDAGDVTTLDMFKPISGVIEGTAVSTEADFDGDSNKITYISPRLWGFQAGGSFTPINNDVSNSSDPSDPSRGTAALSGSSSVSTIAPISDQHSGWSAAVNYSNVFAFGLGVRASFGATGFNQTLSRDGDGSNNGAMQIRGGGQFSYAGFTVGGGYKRTYGNGTTRSAVVTAGGTVFTNDGGGGFTSGGTPLSCINGPCRGNAVTRSLNGEAWSIGGTYETGPYKVGVTYVTGRGVGHQIPGTGQYDSRIGTVAGTYLLGPGIRLRGGFFGFLQRAEGIAAAGGGRGGEAFADGANTAAREVGIHDTANSRGWGGAIALTASF